MSSVEVLEVPEKSENDKKSYRVIRLTNGLKAILVSVSNRKNVDSEQSTTDKNNNESKSNNDNKPAACSLLVDVGSFSNPNDVQGLAHFLGNLT